MESNRTKSALVKRNNRYYLVCDECRISHIENCNSCFGWGFYADGRLISASEAHDLLSNKTVAIDKTKTQFLSCMECGSDVRGYLGE